MQTIKYIIGLLALTLTIFLTSNNSFSENITTGNLLPNAGDGPSSLGSNQTENLNDSFGDFSTSGNVSNLNNDIETGSGEDNKIYYQGDLVGITTNSDTTTQEKLNNGITLTNKVDVQNCEHNQSGYSTCGTRSGTIDTWSTTTKILDADDNILSTSTLTRTDHSGYQGNCGGSNGGACDQETDVHIYTGSGSNQFYWEFSGTDNSNATSGLVGPNIMGALLTMTYSNIILTQEQEENIEGATEMVEEAIEEIENINWEEVETIAEAETIILEVLEIEEIKIEELPPIEEIKEIFVQEFKEMLVETNLVEEFEVALVEEQITEQEFFEEAATMVVAVFEEETGQEIVEEKPSEKMEEPNEIKQTEEKQEVKSNKPTETKTETKEEPNAEPNEPSNANSNEPTETSTTEEVVETNEETESTGQESENVSTESEVDENQETEGQEETESDGEIVQNKSDVSVKDGGKLKTKVEPDSISKKVAKIIKKLEAKLKRVDDKIKATSYVLAVTLQNLQPDMGSYLNKSIPDGQNLVGIPNDDFFDNINRIAQQQIYKDASLVAYTSNDPIAVHTQKLIDIDMKKNKVKAEIAALRSLLQ